MNNALTSLFALLKQNIWYVCLAVAAILVLTIVLFFVQWKRVSNRKKHPKTRDWSVEAKHEIEHARALIEAGLLKGLSTEFGATVPSDASLIQNYICDTYSLRAGGIYISVDLLSVFVHQVPYIFLQGSDNMGGESVLPLKVSETGEHFFYLEGLSICYRRDDYRYTVNYNIRFSLEKSQRPIEEVLEFEVA